MPEFQTIDPAVEVWGISIQGALGGMQQLGLDPEAVAPILRRHGMEHVDPSAWYPQQAYLDCLRDLGEQWGQGILRELGRLVPATSKFPPEIHSMDRALRTLDIAYHMNHRGGEIGNYLYEPFGPREGLLHCDNPYGCEVDMGIIEGLGTRFIPDGGHLRLEHLLAGRCRKGGGPLCLYRLVW